MLLRGHPKCPLSNFMLGRWRWPETNFPSQLSLFIDYYYCVCTDLMLSVISSLNYFKLLILFFPTLMVTFSMRKHFITAN